jgi:hypothetical protein
VPRSIRELSRSEWNEMIRGKTIRISEHALDHLSIAQRKLFIGSQLTRMLGQNPRKAYLQDNGRFATYHRTAEGYRKLITEIGEDIVIITFMDVIEVPR